MGGKELARSSFEAFRCRHALGGIPSQQACTISFYLEPRPLAYATRTASAGGAASTSWYAVDTAPSLQAKRCSTACLAFKIVSN